jgi:8-oxo-dGTP pyrophosphatase MutT (NUDIX family)
MGREAAVFRDDSRLRLAQRQSAGKVAGGGAPMPEPPPGESDPVTPRHAASLIVLHGGASGPKLLMGMRGADHRFMPNCLVFPGGSVDAADSVAPAASEPRPEVMRRLLVAAGPTLARALLLAAARELEEETGLTLGRPPALDGLDYLCRAITPAALPVRFDARFLIVGASHVSGRLAGSGVLEGLRWYGLEEALALDLAIVTRGVIERLKDWLAMDEAARRARTETPLLRERVWRLE